MRLLSALAQSMQSLSRRLVLRRARWAGLPRKQRFRFIAAVPLPAAAVALAGCAPLLSDHDRAPPPCVETHDQGCVPESEYAGLVEEIAATHAQPSSFRNQWGLETIRAHRAYAHLELQSGPDATPGDGVTVGVVDSGIDAAHLNSGMRMSSNASCSGRTMKWEPSFRTALQWPA